MTKSETTESNGHSSQRQVAAGVICIGSIVELDADGKPLVDFSENPDDHPLIALSTLSLTRQHINRQVALLFNNGDLRQPVIMGLIHNPLDELLQNFELMPIDDRYVSNLAENNSLSRPVAAVKRENDERVYVDGKQVVIEGAEEVTFKCGKASITLTRSGKILIRGTYLLNRSTGVNRIMGGSVQVN